ncbi:hypothetical protein E3T55_18780 [Cryobacterium frigoriphilum]|uniref:Uncharacterized protein n=1 Tax=Cryobacterium frigoriphilum TaxID=1259150 RepID=A0A4R8ZTY0_9MICO|nr:hypothetical protein [Cryobacterium frigoriphilum]TFD45382.1 hypothetical protein E3T55_18780 [Cryobacterium frigoriphilum]
MPPPDDTEVAASHHQAAPPTCPECELPLEEVTHSYTWEWACINDLCARRFCATFEELTHPDLLIILGQPDCYRCHQRRTMTQVGNQVRFTCPNPRCNELVRLIGAKAAQATKARAAALNKPPDNSTSPPPTEPALPLNAPPPLSLVEPRDSTTPVTASGRNQTPHRDEPHARPRHLHAVPPLPTV